MLTHRENDTLCHGFWENKIHSLSTERVKDWVVALEKSPVLVLKEFSATQEYSPESASSASQSSRRDKREVPFMMRIGCDVILNCSPTSMAVPSRNQEIVGKG